MRILTVIIILIIFVGAFYKSSKKVSGMKGTKEEIKKAKEEIYKKELQKSGIRTIVWMIILIVCLIFSIFIGFTTDPFYAVPLMIISVCYCIYRIIKKSITQ